jgi:hypothetical protein
MVNLRPGRVVTSMSNRYTTRSINPANSVMKRSLVYRRYMKPLNAFVAGEPST